MTRIFPFILTTLLAVAGCFLFTTAGSDALVRWAVLKKASPESITYQKITGNLIQGLSYDGLEITHIPSIAVLRAQKLHIGWNFSGFIVALRNGRLIFHPDYDPILIRGHLRNHFIVMNCYSKSLDVSDVVKLISRDKTVRSCTGALFDVEANVRGTMRSPQFSGSFFTQRFTFKGFSLTEAPVSFDLRFEKEDGKLQLTGEVQFHKGTLISRQATVQLDESELLFSGNPKNPTLRLKGSSKIQGVEIFINLKGTLERPDLDLASEPSLPQNELLLMLATGRRWRNIGKENQGAIPLDLAKDFVDYFTFSGFGEQMARRFGLEGIFLTYSPGGIGVSKDIANKAELSYGFEQQPPDLAQRDPVTTHKLGAEYKVNESVSINAEQDVRQEDAKKSLTKQEEPQTASKVFVKYKTKF